MAYLHTSGLHRQTPPDVAATTASATQAAPLSADAQPPEWQACATLAELVQLDDTQALQALRRTAKFQQTMGSALESQEADFLDRLHPGTRHDLLRWLTQDSHTPLPADAGAALSKLTVLLSVREGDGTLRAKTAPEREAEAVLLRWAGTPTPQFADFRRLLIWNLMRLHHDGSQELRERLPNQSPCWSRLDRAGLLSCLGALTDRSEPSVSTCGSSSLNRRLTHLLDQVMGDDALAADCAADAQRAAEPSGASARAPLETLGDLEGIAALHGEVRPPRMEPREGWLAFGTSLEDVLAAGGPDVPTTPGAPSTDMWVRAWQSMTRLPQLLSSQTTTASPLSSTDSYRSVLLARLDSRVSERPSFHRMDSRWSSNGGAVQRQDSRWSSNGGSVQRQDSRWSESASSLHRQDSSRWSEGAVSLRRQESLASRGHSLPRWDDSSAPNSVVSRAYSSPTSTPAFTPAMGSLEWLPSVRQGAFPTPDREDEELPCPVGRLLDPQEVQAVQQVLDAASALPQTPVTAQWCRAAQTVLGDRVFGDGSARLNQAEMALLQRTVFRLMRLGIDRVSGEEGGTPGGLRLRGPAEEAALRALVDWSERASGAELIRRDRWVEAIADRALQPDAAPAIPATLLRQGDALPPWPCVRALVGGDRVRDMATLVWRGEPMDGGQELSRLLEGLGARHLDVPISAIGEDGLPPSLALDCMSAATLRLEGPPDPARLTRALDALTDRMRSLYMVRLADRHGPVTVDSDDLPSQWDTDPHVPGRLVHLRRDGMRELIEPLRELWPSRRMPPALRSSALNPQHGGGDVLEYLGDLRGLRAGHPEFREGDLEMCVRLDSVIEGLASDEDYTRRCRELVRHPDGPCSDAGMRMLAKMSEMWEMAEATTADEVAENALVQACLNRADHVRAERRPDHVENLEDALVLRWFVSAALSELLGNDRVRISPKPMFGRYSEGDDWDTPERRRVFQAEAAALIRAEVEAEFPGVVALVASEGPMGMSFRRTIDAGPAFEALDQRKAAAHEAYEQAVENGEDESAVLARTSQTLADIEQEREQARLDALRPHLSQLRNGLMADPTSPVAGPSHDDDGEPPAKRARF